MRPDPGSRGELHRARRASRAAWGSARTADRFDVAMPLVHRIPMGRTERSRDSSSLAGLAVLRMRRCLRGREHGQAARPHHLARRRSSRARRRDGLARSLATARARCGVRGSRTPSGFPDVRQATPARVEHQGGAGSRRRCGVADRSRGCVRLRHVDPRRSRPGRHPKINCSVLGRGDDVEASVCEQPVSSGTLSYADKYLSGGKGKRSTKKPAAGMKSSERLIPAPISEALTKRIQEAAMTSFRAIGASGVARVDFLVAPDSESFVVNELNTLPGSLSFYLWEASGDHSQERIARRDSSTWQSPGTASSRQPRRRSTRGCSPDGRAERRPGRRRHDHGRNNGRDPQRCTRGPRHRPPIAAAARVWGVSSELFAPILEALQPGRRLIVPDLPGFGATPEPGSAWSVHDYAAWCIRAARPAWNRDGRSHRALERRADRHRHGRNLPGRASARMVLVGSSGIRPRRTLPERAARASSSYKLFRAVERSGAPPSALRRAAARRADQRADPRTTARYPEVMRGTLVRLVNEDLRNLLPHLHLPVLLIWGEHDTETPLDDGRLMEHLITGRGTLSSSRAPVTSPISSNRRVSAGSSMCSSATNRTHRHVPARRSAGRARGRGLGHPRLPDRARRRADVPDRGVRSSLRFLRAGG